MVEVWGRTRRVVVLGVDPPPLKAYRIHRTDAYDHALTIARSYARLGYGVWIEDAERPAHFNVANEYWRQ